MLPSESPINPPDGSASDIESSSQSTWEEESPSPEKALPAPRPWGPWPLHFLANAFATLKVIIQENGLI